jgi:sugar transferase (PEP-CTERM/EpsH1 system associated)
LQTATLTSNNSVSNHGRTDIPTPGARRPIRVLHVLNRLDRGGTELAVIKLMKGLHQESFEHRLVAIRGSDPTILGMPVGPDELLHAGTKNTGLHFPLFQLAKLMRAYRPDVVHSRNWGAIEAIPAARLAQVPVAIHSEHGYELDMLGGLPLRRRAFRRAVYGMADIVFAVTEELRNYHARQAWLPPERIRVIYNGVDTERFFPRPDKRPVLRTQLNLSEGQFVIGTVGRMVPIKDHPTLLRAMELVVNRGINAHALLVGSGPELGRIQQLVAGSTKLKGRVTFLGDSDAVPGLLNAMDVFALPSISEGMANTLLEAMAAGLPVIATGVGGNLEVIEKHVSGWLFPPGDAEALAALLILVANREDLRQRYGVAARQRVMRNFSLRSMLDSYRHLYLEMATNRKLEYRR